MKILIINGPNLNMLGIREPGIYGVKTLEDLKNMVDNYSLKNGIKTHMVQFNSEGEIIDCIHKAGLEYDGIIINPAAYTHYSYAIHDAIKCISIPVVELHISNIHAREGFRHSSVIVPACTGQISGFGFHGYLMALEYFKHKEPEL